MGLGVFLLRFILHGAFSASWTWVTISFPTLGKFSALTSSKISSGPSFFSSETLLWIPVHLMLAQRSFLVLGCFHFFSFFFLYFTLWQGFPPFCPPGHWSVLWSPLFCCWFLLVYFSSVCLFFSSPKLLVHISCIFSIVFPRSFAIVVLNSFSGRLLISTLFVWGGFILSLHVVRDCLLFHRKECSLMWFYFSHCGIVLLLASSVCPLMEEAKRLRASWWEKLGLALVGRALVSKALTQLSADGWGRTPSLLVVRPSPRV